MNIKKLENAVKSQEKYIKSNKSQFDNEKIEISNIISEYKDYNKFFLLSMNEEQIYQYLSPLWAMSMWSNKHYNIDAIIESNGLDLLRSQFSNLIYGESDIIERWDEFRLNVKGIGPAIMSELLCKAHPDKFILWNRKIYNGFNFLDVE